MARRPKATDSTEVQRLRKSLAREKAKRAELDKSLVQAREQETASAEILTLIRRSPSDLRPVFDAIARHALALCGSVQANVFGFDGRLLHFIASDNTRPEQVDLLRSAYPKVPDASTAAGRAVLSRKVVRIEDALSDRDYDQRMAVAGSWRRALAVPMVGDRLALGAIAVAWADPGPIPRIQERLLKTFAAQAVIAIENVRLFNETKEALERQTASSEILRVVAQSVADAQPVFEAILASLLRLFAGFDATVWTVREGLLVSAVRGGGTLDATIATRIPVDGEHPYAAALREHRVLQLDDVTNARGLSEAARSDLLARNRKAVVLVPLVRAGSVLGALSVSRTAPHAFTAGQVDLLKNFADQATIAIENARLFNETSEALEQQTAISEVLRVISSSPADVQPILEAVAIRAAKICDAPDARIFLAEGDQLRHAAGFGEMPVVVHRLPLVRSSAIARAVIDRAAVYIQDIQAERGEDYALSREIAAQSGWRSNLSVPLMREDRALGAISLRRREVRPFTEKQISLLRTFADQAAIAIENVRLFNETKEALERQTATAEILNVIARSPADVQPVLDAVAENAARLCGATDALILSVEADTLLRRAHFGPITSVSPARPLTPDTPTGRAVLERRTIHIEDIVAELERGDYREAHALHKGTGFRTILAVPLVREDSVIGAISIRRLEVLPFTAKQIELLRTFADQAVIAIENVRLFNETKEALERQTATADILKVISASPTDVQPVLEAVAENAGRLCDAQDVSILESDGEVFRVAAFRGAAQLKLFDGTRVTRASVAGRAILDRRLVQVDDITAEPAGEFAVSKAAASSADSKTMLATPLLREGTPIGAIFLRRTQVRPFSAKQIELLRTFADQAVIAIENVRLFNETKEALEQQTAISEILRVMSDSPSDVSPVLDAVAERSMRICESTDARIFVVDGEQLRYAAGRGDVATLELGYTRPLSRGFVMGRAVLDRTPVHIEDLASVSESEYPLGREIQRQFGHRTTLAVPLVREGKALGVILLRRMEVRSFTDKQIALLKTFSDQAAIAIENVRLFNETKEALERQTATAEILKVIAGSPTDVQPVFDVIVQRAVQLCGARFGRVYRYDGSIIEMVAGHGLSAKGLHQVRQVFPRAASDDTIAGQVILTKQPFFVKDIEQDDSVPELSRQMIAALDTHSQVTVPMLRGGESTGAITMGWDAPGAFDDQKVELLRTFADQAVIAIENVRLFNETKEALERQTAAAEVLRVISNSPTDTQPVFEAIAQSGLRLFPEAAVAVALPDGDQVRAAAIATQDPAVADAWRARFPNALSRDHMHGTAILDRRLVDVSDAEAEVNGPMGRGIRNFLASGNKAMTVVPMIRGEEAIGAISVIRRQAGALKPSQIALLQTFADQAVIAIENVRLFNETKEALERQTATAEILKVISSSPTDTQPVFDAIVDSCARLFEGLDVGLNIVRGNGFDRVAVSNRARLSDGADMFPMPMDRTSVVGRALIDGESLQIEDLAATEWIKERARDYFVRRGFGSALCAPMLRDGKPIGGIIVFRAVTGRFKSGQVALLKTFADQAVIAIENVRLFRELQSRTEALSQSVGQLTALGEVGQAISSTLDLEKVLKTIATHAVQLTGLDGASIYEYDEASEAFRLQAADNQAPEVLKAIRSSPIRKGDGTVGRVAITLEPIQVADILDESYRSTRKELLVGAGYRAVLTVPLLREDRIIGALSVTRKTAGPFAPEIVELLQTFATQSAMAIQNARLFREIAEKGKQLEVASHHKSQFLASMSHELRTPLNALLGFNEMILGDIYGPVPPDMQPPLEQMQASGKHLLRLINNVLDLAKIEAGRMELALSDYSVQDTVEAVRSTLRPLAAEKGVELLATVPADIPLAYGDSGRITQCLMNLAGNSLKFTKVGRVEISVAENGETLTYRVADTGIGIPPDKMENLFTEFKQTDATIASEYGGTGLGLSISKKFVEMHGGRIWAESLPGHGSTFSFEIPLRAGEGNTA